MGDNAAERKHDRVVGHGERASRILFDQQHAQLAILDQLFDAGHDLGQDPAGQAKRWFVEQQHAWAGGKRAGDREHLALPAGKGRGGEMPPLGERHE